MSSGLSEVSERANERTDERVAQYSMRLFLNHTAHLRSFQLVLSIAQLQVDLVDRALHRLLLLQHPVDRRVGLECGEEEEEEEGVVRTCYADGVICRSWQDCSYEE